MSSSIASHGDIAINVNAVSKAYRIWRDPAARLKYPLFQALGNVLPCSLHPAALRRRIGTSHQTSYYKDFYALKDISFAVKKGETVGILGRNGSGKSTLLQIIAGTLTATSGSTQTDGRIAALLELGSGFNPEFTGHENVLLNASIMGLTPAEIETRYPDIIKFADISDFIHQPVKTYSSGMAVRLGFSVAIHTNPSVLIVDEALAVGDIGFQQKCYSRLKSMKAAGVSILLVTHDISAVTQLCDRGLVIDRGSLVFNGDTHQAVNEFKKLVTSAETIKTSEIQEKAPPKAFSYPIAPTIHESGDHSAEIIHWVIEDEQGVPTSTLLFNQNYTVEISVRIRMEGINPNVGFFFSDARGNEIAGTAIHHQEVYLGVTVSGDTRTIRFTFKNQARAGVYFFNTGCSEIIDDKLIAYHRIYSATLLNFESRKPTVGNWFMNSTITISQ